MGRLDSRCQRVALTRPLPCTQGSGGGGNSSRETGTHSSLRVPQRGPGHAADRISGA